MENFKQTYMPVQESMQPSSKSDGSFLKVAGIIALVMASPFIASIAFFAGVSALVIASMLFGTMHEFAPWALLTLLAICFVPSIKDRITGRHNSEKLKQRIDFLQSELIEARKQILELEEGAEFHRKLEGTNRKNANSASPVNLSFSATKSQSSLRT